MPPLTAATTTTPMTDRVPVSHTDPDHGLHEATVLDPDHLGLDTAEREQGRPGEPLQVVDGLILLVTLAGLAGPVWAATRLAMKRGSWSASISGRASH